MTNVTQAETEARKKIEEEVLHPRGLVRLPENLAKLDLDFIRESGYVPVSFLEQDYVDALYQTHPHLVVYVRGGVSYIHRTLLTPPLS